MTNCWANFIDDIGNKIPNGWEWFVTLTFKKFNVHPEAANKAWLRWFREIETECFGKKYVSKGLGLTYVRATEMQNREVIHYHALIGGGLGQTMRYKYKERWFETNGIARVFKYEGTKGARRYVAKYVSKGGELDVFVPPRLATSISLKYSCPAG